MYQLYSFVNVLKVNILRIRKNLDPERGRDFAAIAMQLGKKNFKKNKLNK